MIIEGKEKAIYYKERTSKPDIKLWCDGSKLDTGDTGAAVVWKYYRQEEWHIFKVSLGWNKEIFDAKMWGISEAVKVAEYRTREVQNASVISIFCDSQTAINNLREDNSFAGQALKMQIYQKTERLVQKGMNEKADRAAKEAARGRKIRTARWTSLAHVKRQIMEERKLQIYMWYEQKARERESFKRGFYIPCLKTQIHPLLGKTKKLYASRFYQLKTGHGAIGTFLERIGKLESAECSWCGEAEQSVIHLYTKCRKWRTQRLTLRKDLGKIGI